MSYPMWSYLKNKEGYINAIRNHHAETLKRSPSLQFAISQIEQAQATIDKIMEESEREELKSMVEELKQLPDKNGQSG